MAAYLQSRLPLHLKAWPRHLVSVSDRVTLAEKPVLGRRVFPAVHRMLSAVSPVNRMIQVRRVFQVIWVTRMPQVVWVIQVRRMVQMTQAVSVRRMIQVIQGVQAGPACWVNRLSRAVGPVVIHRWKVGPVCRVMMPGRNRLSSVQHRV